MGKLLGDEAHGAAVKQVRQKLRILTKVIFEEAKKEKHLKK